MDNNSYNKHERVGSGVMNLTNINLDNLFDVTLSDKLENNQVLKYDIEADRWINAKIEDISPFDSKADFPSEGDVNKIYIDSSTNLLYRWDSTTKGYVEVGRTLGEGELNAYPGNKGKKNADDIQDLKDTKADWGTTLNDYGITDAATADQGALADSAVQSLSFGDVQYQGNNIKLEDLPVLTDDQLGVAGGIATLDAAGKVPMAQLPSYVDDVIEYDNLASFPTTGEAGKIYVAKDTNLTYRWSGSGYVEISQSLAIGETSSTAFAGDRGKALEESNANKINAGVDVTPGRVAVWGNDNITLTDANIALSDDKLYVNDKQVIDADDIQGYVPNTRTINGKTLSNDITIEIGDITGGVTTDQLNEKMDKVNPTGSGYVSIGRKENTSIGMRSVAIGDNNEASANDAITVGCNNTVLTTAGSAFGHGNKISGGSYSTAIGYNNTVTNQKATAIGSNNTCNAADTFAFGKNNTSSNENTVTIGKNNVAKSYNAIAIGESAVAGDGTTKGNHAIAIGHNAKATGSESVALGYETKASGDCSFACGYNAQASSQNAMACGNSTIASGQNSFSEGDTTYAIGNASHAEGKTTHANGNYSHVEGYYTTANNEGSHAEGNSTIASCDYQHVQGKYNIEDTEGKYAHIIGNGTYADRVNIHTVDWDGNAWFAGGVQGTSFNTPNVEILDNENADFAEVTLPATSGTLALESQIPTAAADINAVASDGIVKSVKLISRANYDALETKDDTILYLVY